MTDAQYESGERRADDSHESGSERIDSDTAGPVLDRVRQIGIVAEQEYRLAFRNRWTVGLTALFASFGTLLVLFGGSSVGTARVGPLVASLTSLGTYLLPLAAFAFGHDAVVGADERGWLDVLFALPAPRWAIVSGKYAGRAATFAASTAIGFGIAGFLIVLRFGAAALGIYATFLLASVGVGIAFLAVATLVSTVADQRTHALGVSLIAWLWFVLVHDLVALGIVAALDLGDRVLSVLVLLNPADVYRVFVLRSVGAQGGALAAVLAETGLSTFVLVATLVVWVALPVAVFSFAIRYRRV